MKVTLNNIWSLACVVAALGLNSTGSIAQEAAVGLDVEVSRTSIENRLHEVQSSNDLAADRRDELVALYREAIQFIGTRSAHIAEADAYAQMRITGPAEIERLRSEIEQKRIDASATSLNLPGDVDLNTVQQWLQNAKAEHAAAVVRFDSITQQLATQISRPSFARQRLVEIRRLIERFENDLALPVQSGDAASLSEARRWVRRTHSAALHAEIRMLDEELLSQPIRQELLEEQREEISLSLAGLEARTQRLESYLADQLRGEAARLVADSESIILGDAAGNAVVAELAEGNRRLSVQLATLTDATVDASADIVAAREWALRIQGNFQTAQQRMEVVGLNQALGGVLHEQRRDLPKQREYRIKANIRQQAIVASGLRDIEFDAEWIALQNPDVYLRKLLAKIPQSEWAAVRDPLGELVDNRRELMRKARSGNSTYIHTLGELEFVEQQLLNSSDEFDTFLSKRLMWVRSAPVISLTSLQALPQRVFDFLAPQSWIDVAGALIERAIEAPVLGTALFLVLLLLWKANAIKHAIRATGRQVGNPRRDSYAETVKAIGLTTLLVLPWPLLAFAIGSELNRANFATDNTRAIGAGFLAAANFLMFLLSARELLLARGIAQTHFRWSADLVKGLRREINRLLVFFMIPGFVVVVVFEYHLTNEGGELSRVMFIVATIALLNFLVKLLRPEKGLLCKSVKQKNANADFSVMWVLIGAGIPATMIMATLAGFLYSATTLMDVLIDTFWLILAVIFGYEMISRWLVVIRQRLVHQERLREWEAAREAIRKQAEGTDKGEEIPLQEDGPMVDVTNLDADARKLLRMGMFIALIVGLRPIWAPILPALSILDSVTLWTRLEGIGGVETVVPVTLSDLGMVLIILITTIFASQSIPSLLEAVFRQHTSVGAGSRLAFATLTRYGIVMLGIILIADGIGFKWGQIQWLVAALGVGIGFGLQEIIANFISGLIILLERPIRVGDIVTIGDISGRVSRIQIRATTVINWDRQELLVPNKEFITGRVLNWTLSDEVVRLVTAVGISYGSDMPKAMSIINRVVEENERVLSEPIPLVTFDEFGDNALAVTVRCFIDSPAHRREVKSELNLSINEALRDAGIVVAFPQRDVHLDTSSPLDIRIHDGRQPVGPA